MSIETIQRTQRTQRIQNLFIFTQILLLRPVVICIAIIFVSCGYFSEKYPAINNLRYRSLWWTRDCYPLKTGLTEISKLDTIKLTSEEPVCTYIISNDRAIRFEFGKDSIVLQAPASVDTIWETNKIYAPHQWRIIAHNVYDLPGIWQYDVERKFITMKFEGELTLTYSLIAIDSQTVYLIHKH